MSNALALVQIIMPLLPTITTGVNHLIAWIQSVRTAAQQANEWTDEMEIAFRKSLEETKTNPAYQPDA